MVDMTMKTVRLEHLIQDNFKGITPSYVDNSSIIVLNQKCIRNNSIDYSFARFHNPSKSFSDKKIVQVGDILINSTGAGTAGRCAFVKELPKNKTVITDSHILTIRISDFYQAGCIEYLLFGMEDVLQTYMDGSTGQGEFDKQRLYNIEIPEFKKPKFIYNFLTNLEKKIALNNQINAQLEQMAKTLYDYWFVQFDFPDENGKPYKSSGGAMIYNEQLKREIPKGWGVGVLSGILDKVPNSDNVLSRDISNMGLYPVIDQSQEYICGFTNNSKSVITPQNAHIVFGDHSKTVKLVNFPYARGADGTQIIISKEPRMPNYLFYQVIKEIDLSNYGYARHYKFLKEKNVVIPNKVIANKYNLFCENIFTKVLNNIKQNQQLTHLRDFLLPMLMNGQVGVRDE